MARRIALVELLHRLFSDLDKNENLARILCGEILVNGERIRDPRTPVLIDSAVEFKKKCRFVSRGGEKLDPVVKLWNIQVEGLTFIDAGSSRGGFTDCLLQRGARHVYAVDVGYNQLDYRLRMDGRVGVLERTNVMSLEPKQFNTKPDAAVMDLSFRSARNAAFHLLSLLQPQGWILGLIKPQFEWNNPSSDFRGVVQNKEQLQEILIRLLEDLWQEGSFIQNVCRSPLLGRKGNQEFFFLIQADADVSKDEALNKILRSLDNAHDLKDFRESAPPM